LLQLNSDSVAVRAVKLAEDNDQIVIRLQELNGSDARTVELTAASGLKNVVALDDVEKQLGAIKSQKSSLALDFKPYQLRSLGVDFHAPIKLSPPVSVPVKLAYNLDIFSFNEAKEDGDCDAAGGTIPAEMIGDSVVSEGITFKIGSRTNGQQNAISCEGQTIPLPKGKFNRIYLLALAVHGDTEGTFKVDNNSTQLRIENWSGYIGQWDNRVFQGSVADLTSSVNNPLERIDAGFIKRDPLAWFCSHRHQKDGSDQVYTYSYLFKYRLDIPASAKTLTLPENSRIRVVAITMAQNDNDASMATRPLYDDFSGRTAPQLKDGAK
jgi:alpha-mannosidase